ncbi:MAG: sigma-70 family RNA polymerase sigma factor [Elainellaceae cyanobacterium]
MNQNRNGPEQSSQDLKNYFSHVLAVDAEYSDRSLLFFIKRRLLQYGLSESLAVEDVLHEAFVRTERSLRGNNAIQNIPAWVNRVSLNIIREHSRKAISSRKISLKVKINSEVFANFIESDSFTELHAQDISNLFLALNQLNASERAVLELKHIKRYPWKDIAAQLSSLEGKSISAATARKRGERALAKLKSVFSKATVDKR